MVKIPTIREIHERIMGDFRSNISIKNSLILSFINALAWAYAGCSRLLYQGVLSAHLDIFPTTANISVLKKMGIPLGIAPREPVQAEIEIKVENQTDKDITLDFGTEFKSPNNCIFTLVSPATIEAKQSKTLHLKAEKTGLVGSVNIEDVFELAKPIDGLIFIDISAKQKNIKVTILVHPREAEDVETFRTRLINRMRLRPQGGSPIDYLHWSQELEFVGSVFPIRGYKQEGSDIIYEPTLYFLTNDPKNRIPDKTQVDLLKNHLNSIDKKPMHAVINVDAPEEIHLNLEVTSFDTDTSDTPIAKNLATQEITELLLKKHPYIRGIDNNENIEHITKGEILSILSRHGNFNSVTMEFIDIDGNVKLTNNYTLEKHQVIKLGDITW